MRPPPSRALVLSPLLLCFENGTTWRRSTLVWAGPSGYSQLVSLGSDPKAVGILLEAGAETTYETISFAVVAVTKAKL